MRKKSNLRNVSVLLCLFIFLSISSLAQTEQQKLTATILHADSLFWNAYNNCDTAKYKDFFTNDVEFYHDKGGTTLGIEALISSLEKNLCSNPDYRLRREAVSGTVKVYPLQKGNDIYGAIISGEHVFYIWEKGKNERLDGHARFADLWLLKDSVWKMARILSYDHQPAVYENKRKEITLSHATLDKWEGTYKGEHAGLMTVKRENDLLILQIGDKKYMLYPESDTIFFTKERDLTFEFIKDKEKISKLVVREFGAVAEEAVFLK